MRVFREQKLLREYLAGLAGRSIGFVPTMGALHAGHLSLVELSKKSCDVTVCSVFVNPTQFNDPTDLAKYPRNEAADTALLEQTGCDVLYVPEVTDIYPDGVDFKAGPATADKLVDYDLGRLDSVLEGASRPEHFKGVANVVKRLLDAVQPDTLFLGQKDYQQVAVIRKLIALTGLKTKVVTGETVREPNGLAMSSRNERLDAMHRAEAGKIYKALLHIKSSFKKTSWHDACHQAVQILNTIPDSNVDYLKLCNADTLEELDNWNNIHRAVCLVAVWVDGVRLIDNIMLNER